MKIDWKELTDWEDRYKTVVFMTISPTDIRDYYADYYAEKMDESDQTNKFTDEELYDALQYVCRKYDFGETYGDIYEWAVEHAEEWKKQEDA